MSVGYFQDLLTSRSIKYLQMFPVETRLWEPNLYISFINVCMRLKNESSPLVTLRFVSTPLGRRPTTAFLTP